MGYFEFVVTVGISVISLGVALWAIRVSLKGNSLLMTLTKSIQAFQVNQRRNLKQNAASETAKQMEIRLKEQAEQRKGIELELKKQQQDWKRKKDVPKLIGWFFDNLERSDDE